MQAPMTNSENSIARIMGSIHAQAVRTARVARGAASVRTLALAKLSQIGNELVDFVRCERLIPARHQLGLVNGITPPEDRAPDLVLSKLGHLRRAGVVSRPHAKTAVVFVDPFAVDLAAMTLNTVEAVIVLDRSSRRWQGNREHQ